MDILEQVNLREYNTFGVAASARYFTVLNSVDDLYDALAFAKVKQVPFLIMGQGSNVLFQDDFPGLVLVSRILGHTLEKEDEESYLVTACSGEIWHDFVQWCLAQGYYGLENLSLIPGTVGAAPIQNIGAYGVELKDVVFSLEAIDTLTGDTRTFTQADCEFGYRNSIFKQSMKGRYVIHKVTFRLGKSPRVNLSYAALARALEGHATASITPALVSQTVCDIRRSKLPDPDKLGNAGSFFRNPEVTHLVFDQLSARFPDIVGYPAGNMVKLAAAWLIEQTGWKGYREGDAGVHQNHALVLVNYGKATGRELVKLSEKIQRSVKQRFGVELEPEVRII
jgi:UDP-N-acetylmuramate dehydrogenase